MTEQERLLLEQQQRQQAIPVLAPAKSYALGQDPGAYQESGGVIAARNAHQTTLAQKPTAYTSPYQGQIDAAYQKILSRQPFKYDMNTDMLYQQYKDQYTMQGKKAMQDTMGNAQAMTGGYGNSYAQTVGQQTNQAYMTQITDKLPEMQDRAYGKYRDEGTDDINRLGLTQGMEDRGYSKYRDTVGDWNNEESASQNAYNTERGFDIDMYRNAVTGFQSQREYDFGQEQYGYQKEQDTAQRAFQRQQFDYGKTQDTQAQAWNQSQFDYQKSQDAQAYALKTAAAAPVAAPPPKRNPPPPKLTPEQIAEYEARYAEEQRLKAEKAAKAKAANVKRSGNQR